ncbi:MAG: type II toxin-antitoxin system prevent-host-death family antitoxin [Propionibacteriaceae bacterium]|jgi:prevent-host-death family protein|nr:type II toxin-antitoxin system prevent-host-death family antitoxin [Propionibacteriaceae bacterium]
MTAVAVKELNQHTSEVLDRVTAAGRPVAITRHGRIGWFIVPASGSASPVKLLIEAGLASEPNFDEPLPPPIGKSREEVDRLLAEMDEDH